MSYKSIKISVVLVIRWCFVDECGDGWARVSPMCRRLRRRLRTTGSNSQGFRWSPCSRVYVIYLRVFHPPCCQSRSYITYYTYISVYNNTVLYYYAVTSVRIHTLTHKFNSIRSVIAWRPMCSTQQYYT